MKIGKLSVKWIGARVRKPHWSSCSMMVLDIGTKYVVGQIFDHEIKKVVDVDLYDREDDEWELYLDAKSIIELLPVRWF